MRRSDNRQDGGPVGLLPGTRERRILMRNPISSFPASLDGPECWVLLAMAYADTDGRGANLGNVRRLNDLLQNTDVSDDEFQASLYRLVAMELVLERDGLFHPAESVTSFLRTRTFRRGVTHDHRDLLRHLHAVHPG